MKKYPAIILGVAFASGAAIAGNEGDAKQADTAKSTPYHALAFEDLDVNEDNLISAQEATDSDILDSQAFASADTDGDGSLSRKEFDASAGMDPAAKRGLDVVDHPADVEEFDDES
ncbi:hypothetical protein BH24PSE2_BH24PSE2_00310 [soil metagenome]